MRNIEMKKLVALYYEHQDWGKVRAICLENNVLQQRTERSLKKLYAELASRLKCLESEALTYAHTCSSQDQEMLFWLAICRRYDFIYDFSVEVLREHMLMMNMELNPYHFSDFWDTKALQYEHLGRVKDSTKQKAQQIVFSMLREVKLIDAAFKIQVINPSPSVIDLISASNIDDLRIYPISDNLINLKKV